MENEFKSVQSKMARMHVLLASVIAIVAVSAVAVHVVTRRLPSVEQLSLGRGKAGYLALRTVPKPMQDATVAIEDDRFYSHSGLDVRGIGRAALSNVRGGHLGQGGSTITQQLARNAYDLGTQKTLTRKVQEAVLALRLEQKYSKREILEGYFNKVYYGAGAFGLRTAANTYFGKPVEDLSLPECALLAGLPQRPTDYNPYTNPAAAVQRRNIVLARMEQLHYITAVQAQSAEAAPVLLAHGSAGRVFHVTRRWQPDRRGMRPEPRRRMADTPPSHWGKPRSTPRSRHNTPMTWLGRFVRRVHRYIRRHAPILQAALPSARATLG